MTRNRVMRGAALVLAAVILPLAAFAAVSMGLRLDQYGLAPERLWGMVAIVVACVCGVAYWIALGRGRKGGWAGYLRKATLDLALVVCGLAVLLALPVLDFGAISTRNQVARLSSGAVPADEFDYAALRWDFGEAGRRALRRMARGSNPQIAELAEAALSQTERVYGFGEQVRAAADFDLRVQPDDPELRRLVLEHLRGNAWQCEERCVALDLGAGQGGRRVAIVQGSGYQVLLLKPGEAGTFPPEVAPAAVVLREGSAVEIREVPTRYIFIDGRRIGQPLEQPTAPLEASPPPR